MRGNDGEFFARRFALVNAIRGSDFRLNVKRLKDQSDHTRRRHTIYLCLQHSFCVRRLLHTLSKRRLRGARGMFLAYARSIIALFKRNVVMFWQNWWVLSLAIGHDAFTLRLDHATSKADTHTKCCRVGRWNQSECDSIHCAPSTKFTVAKRVADKLQLWGVAFLPSLQMEWEF